MSESIARDKSDQLFTETKANLEVDQVDRERSGGVTGVELKEESDNFRVREKWVLSQRNTFIS